MSVDVQQILIQEQLQVACLNQSQQRHPPTIWPSTINVNVVVVIVRTRCQME